MLLRRVPAAVPQSVESRRDLRFLSVCALWQEHTQTHQAGPSLSSQKPRVFKCGACEKAFAKPSQLERHSRIHTGNRAPPASRSGLRGPASKRDSAERAMGEAGAAVCRPRSRSALHANFLVKTPWFPWPPWEIEPPRAAVASGDLPAGGSPPPWAPAPAAVGDAIVAPPKSLSADFLSPPTPAQVCCPRGKTSPETRAPVSWPLGPLP